MVAAALLIYSSYDFIYFVPVFDSAKRKPAAPFSCGYSFGLG
jgi:hypothetical protein